MRVMCLDYGTARVGVAISDEMAMMALPLETIPAKPQEVFIDRLRVILAEKQASLIVVGIPRNMDGSYGAAATQAKEFIEMLKAKLGIPVEGWDERLTTVSAHRMLSEAGIKTKKHKDKVDKIAAQTILQSYLDAQEFKNL